jgi:ribosomal-protein-alanine N-acetyltransferase
MPTPQADPLHGATSLPTLETPRLRLRWLRDEDFPALFAIFGDEETMRYWSTPKVASVDEVAAIVNRIRASFVARDAFQWGFAARDSDEILGTTTLHRVNWPHRRAEVGYALNRAHWGKGLASEAVGAVVAFAFETLGLHRLEADTDPRNAASIGVLERLGFVRDGLLKERYHVGGEVQDALLLGLLAPDWRARRTA